MFDPHKITIEDQPVAEIPDELLDKLIQREFPKDIYKVKSQLNLIISDSNAGKNRFSAAVLKLAHGDITKLKPLIERCNHDFRDIVSEAEYPKYGTYGFDTPNDKRKEIYAADWNQYSDWLNKDTSKK